MRIVAIPSGAPSAVVMTLNLSIVSGMLSCSICIALHIVTPGVDPEENISCSDKME